MLLKEHSHYFVLAFVALTAVVALTVAVKDDVTGEVTGSRPCNLAGPNWVNCLSENGGCPAAPEGYAPYKQYGLRIGNVPTCCCALLKSAEDFRYGQSLYD